MNTQEKKPFTCSEDQRAIVDDTNKSITDDIVEEYIAETGDEELANFQEAYSGEFSSDKAFAQDMAEQCGDMPKENHWPHYCIDWEYAARDLMMDYTVIDGHYFRNM